jgi:hypothetical protein
VEINDVEGEIFLQGTECPSTSRHNGFEEKWEQFLLETISMLFNPGTFLIKHPLGTSDYTGDGYICNDEDVQLDGLKALK